MEAPTLPDEINEATPICRICLSDERELQSIFSYGQICDKNVRLVEVVTDCTSIEFDENDSLPATICQQCLLQISKIYKFRQMAFKSNFLLRQKINAKQRREVKSYSVTRSHLKIVKAESLEENTATSEPIDEDVEYLTVIVANEESTESGDETIECLIEDPNDFESQQNDEYIVTDDTTETDEIPKMSLANYRRRTKNEDPLKSLTCPECNKTLSNFSSFKYHMQLHSEDTPFLCNSCGEGFKTRNAYDGHMITHLESNPNQCNICNKSYRQAASLRSHMLSHTGEKPYKCDICGKGMTQKSGFKKHMLTHTGEKPHACSLCGKEFRYSSNLIMHKRSHIGEKNFDCSVCSKKFLSKEQLKRHATIHSGIKPYKCDKCKKCFNRRSTLNIHQKVHLDGKYRCKKCSKTFDKQSALVNHELSHGIKNKK